MCGRGREQRRRRGPDHRRAVQPEHRQPGIPRSSFSRTGVVDVQNAAVTQVDLCFPHRNPLLCRHRPTSVVRLERRRAAAGNSSGAAGPGREQVAEKPGNVGEDAVYAQADELGKILAGLLGLMSR